MKKLDCKAYVFHGTRPYGVHVAVARSLETACRLVGVKPEECYVWLEGGFNPLKGIKYGYTVLEEGQIEDYGE